LFLLVRGSLGDHGFVVPPVASGAVFGFAVASAVEKGVRVVKKTRPDGRRVGRHRLELRDVDDEASQ
jgi:hypothetical protein